MTHFIASYGYVAVFVLMIAQAACIPIPSELTMCFGGALAGGAVSGAHPNLVGIIAAGVAGNMVGAYIGWAIGRYGGQAAITRWGRYVWLSEHDVQRATTWFDRYGPIAVLVGQFIPLVRTFIALPAGLAQMRPLRFGVYTIIGGIPWSTGLALAGYAVGSNWKEIANAFNGPTYVVAGVVVVALAVLFVLHVRKNRRRGTAKAPAPGTGSDEERKRATGAHRAR